MYVFFLSEERDNEVTAEKEDLVLAILPKFLIAG
jgi:hypothetical protein